MAVQRQHYTLLATICVALFCPPLMVAGVNSILPELGKSLGASAAQLGMVGAFYALGLTVFQLACGSLGDICGHKRVFLLGCLIFSVCSLLLGFTGNVPLFLALRFAQGTGGAMISAASLALLASASTPENRAAYLGISVMGVYSGIACGPPLAGIIAGSLGWTWLFWFSALTGLIIFFMMRHSVRHEWRPARDKPFDWSGCLTYGIAMGAFTFAATLLKKAPLLAGLLFAAFMIFIWLFYFQERKSAFPILNLELLAKNRLFALSSLAAFINYASFFGVIFYFSFYLQIGKGMSVQETGFILAIQALAQALATPLATRMCKNGREGPTSALGAAICGVGLWGAAFLEPSSSLYQLVAMQVLIGAGASIFALGNTALILASAGKANTGQASAVTGAVRTAGQLASMVIITLATAYFLGSQAVNQENFPEFMSSMRVNLIFFGSMNMGAVFISFLRNRAAR